jgi:cell division protein ZapA (FtsZ GTPase activity inhibitor)
MTHKTNAVSIKILNKEYRINCPTGEEESLIKSANYVEVKHTDQQKLHHIQTMINQKLTEYRGQFEDK